jgi:hypothetical protein
MILRAMSKAAVRLMILAGVVVQFEIGLLESPPPKCKLGLYDSEKGVS